MDSFLILSFLLTGAAGLVSVEEVKVEVGDTITLDCSDSRTPIRAVEWIKDDRPSKFILFYTDGHYYPDHQDSTFKGRVELVDLQHKGGDLSLRLKDVVLNDTGTYKCLVAAGDSRRTKRAFIKGAFIDDKPVRTIQLKVTGSENDNTVNDNTVNDNTMNDNTMNKHVLRSFAGSVAGFVLLLVILGAVVFVFGRRVHKKHLVKRSDEDVEVNDQFIKPPEDLQTADSSP